MERYGYPEETYYTFSYSPVPNADGGIGGIICANTDDTQRIITERQLALLRELANRTAEARTVERACDAAAAGLRTDPRDIPFGLIYLLDPSGNRLTLVCTAGIATSHPAARHSVKLDEPDMWSWTQAVQTNSPQIVTDFGARFDDLPKGSWDRPPQQAVILPLAAPGEAAMAGAFVAGLNPYRLYDEAYQGFMSLVAGQIAGGIANARAYEEERKRAEALAEIDRAKTLFFSNVSHEFRTPLTLMLAPLEDALNDASAARLPAIQRERLDVAHRNSLRLLKLVNTLLEFSRIEAGRVQATFRPTDLAVQTADLASGFRSAVEKAGLYLELDCRGLREPVHVDREMWERVVLNLLSNAFKFTFDGGITVALREEGDHATLSVRDTGAGIPAHELPRLFERFHRIEGQRSRSFEGSGIGLALVQELVRLHGGTISAESKSGRGTVFTVRIPFGTMHLPADRIGQSSEQVPTAGRIEAFVSEALHWLPDIEAGNLGIGAAPSAVEAAGSSRSRVLLVDDNADMRAYVHRLLEARYEVVAVADGKAALRELRRDRPDLVLSDVMMPRLDGFGLLREIRGDPALRGLPVILLSARAGEEAQVEGLETGADDYVVKPFSAQELLARIGANLSLARLRRETAEALRESEDRYRALIELSPQFVFMASPDGAITFVNQYAQDFTGHSLDQLQGSGWVECIRPGDRERISSRWRKAIQDASEYKIEIPFRYNDGTCRWLDTRSVPVRGESGQVLYWIGIAIDITDRKYAEAELEKSAQEAREAQRLARVGSWFWDPVTDVTTGSDELYRIYGLDPAGGPFPDFAAQRGVLYPVADWERINAAVQHAVATGEGYVMDVRAYRGASPIWVTTRCEVVRGHDGRITALRGTVQDISERKTAEAAIRDGEERLRLATEVAEVGFWDVDPINDVLIWPPRVKAMFGISPEVPVSMADFYAGLHPEDRETTSSAYAAAADPARRALYDVEYRTVGKQDGVIRWVAAKGRGVFDECGRCIRVLGTAIDITARKMAEEELRALNEHLEQRVAEEIDVRQQAQARLVQAQRMEALGQLAGGIAHDFNNVLQAVTGGLSLIERRPDAADRVRHLARMASDAAERGKAITGRLLAFARRGELRAAPVEPRVLLEGLQEILGSTLGPMITVGTEIAPDAPPLLADKPQLETVLINLAVNARDAMPAGGELILSARAVAAGITESRQDGLAPGQYVRLDVTDTGIGMDAGTLARACEPFFTTKPTGQGTGLGLAMARGFAEQSCGSFAIRSVPGQGTTVSLWFPQAITGAPETRDTDDERRQRRVPQRVRTLVVDDDPLVRAVLVEQVRSLGHEVTEASDGLAALSMLDSGLHPDLLVTDFAMPGMNGLMLIDEARRRVPDVPAVLLTGFADAGFLREIERAQDERTSLLRKPISEEALAACTAAALGTKVTAAD